MYLSPYHFWVLTPAPHLSIGLKVNRAKVAEQKVIRLELIETNID